MSTRTAGSAVQIDPSNPKDRGEDTRQFRVIKRSLVRGLAPPESGGALNLPAALLKDPSAAPVVMRLQETIAQKRNQLGFPPLETYYVDPTGKFVDTGN